MQNAQIKNVVRGLVGYLRGGRLDPNDYDYLRYYQLKKRSILNLVRSQDSIYDAEKAYQWVSNQLESQVAPSFYHSPDSIYLLTGIPTEGEQSLQECMAWITLRILSNTEKINEFLSIIWSIDQKIQSGDESVIDDIDHSISKLGYSYWVVDAKIQTLQTFKGLEAQKTYVDTLKRVSPKSILAFYAHYTSVRNEPNTSLTSFTASVKRTISRSTLGPSLKSFLINRLTNDCRHRKSEWRDLLNVVASQGIIDLYETFIFVAQSIVLHSSDHELKEFLFSQISKISSIDDYRINKLLLNLGAAPNDVVQSDSRPFVKVLNGRSKSALLGAVRNNSGDLLNDTLGILLSTVSERISKPQVSDVKHSSHLKRLAISIGKGEGYYEFGQISEKIFKNMSFLPRYQFFGYLSKKENSVSATSVSEFHLKCLSLFNENYSVVDSYISKINGNNSGLHKNVLDDVIDLLDGVSQYKDNEFLYDYLVLLSGKKIFSNIPVIAHVEKLIKTGSTPVQRIARLKAIDLYVGEDKLADAIRLTVSLLLTRPDLSDAINLNYLFAGLDWADVSSLKGDMCLPVFLHMVWEKTGEEDMSSLLRHSFDEFLSAHNLTKPSEIIAESEKYARDLLVYFLRHICVKSIMDMNPNLSSSKEVEDERIKICSQLSQLDPDNAEFYQDEHFYISYSQMIQNGIRLVDSSRVHVDVDPINNVLKQELKESFNRYIDLVEAGIGVSDDFDEVMKNLTRRDNTAVGAIMVPDNEADDLLVRMVETVRDKFLFEPSHGLDGYLSKRIRHGSILHHLRQPVENEGIITQRSSKDGRYSGDADWVDRIRSLSPDEKVAVGQIFSVFSRRFDNIILNLKDNLLHIRSLEYPKGMISLDPRTEVYEIIRAAIRGDQNVQSVIQSCIAVFWGLLEASLCGIRSHLKGPVKTEVAETFDGLRHSLSKLVGKSDDFAQLSAAIGRASTGVQSQLDVVAGWFVQSQAQNREELFSLRQAFEICIESSLRSFSGFYPNIGIVEADDINMPASELVKIFEVMWVILQNVHDHSEVLPQPKVEISGKYRSGTLEIFSKNEIGSSVCSEDNICKLEELRTDISNGNYKNKIRRDVRSGTGICKIASLVSQSEKGSVEFGFVDQEEFFIKVKLSFDLIARCS